MLKFTKASSKRAEMVLDIEEEQAAREDFGENTEEFLKNLKRTKNNAISEIQTLIDCADDDKLQ